MSSVFYFNLVQDKKEKPISIIAKNEQKAYNYLVNNRKEILTKHDFDPNRHVSIFLIEKE